jgi:hypothetical protein
MAYRLFDDGDAEIPSAPGQITKEELSVIVGQAKQEWINAQNYFNQATDPELVDHAILSVQVAERKYMYWLKQIKNLE